MMRCIDIFVVKKEKKTKTSARDESNQSLFRLWKEMMI